MKTLIALCMTLFAVLQTQLVLAQEPEDYSYTEETEESQPTEPGAEPTEKAPKLDEDGGAMIMGEVAYLSLGKDDAVIYRGLLGYAFSFGLQLGGSFTGIHLASSCLQAVESGACPAQVAPDGDADFAGPSPFVGWDLKIIPGWFGFQLTAIGTFPVTGGASGWAVEGGVNPYFSFRALSKNLVALAITAPGLKYIHADVSVNRYKLKTDEVMPAFALEGQF